MNVAIITGHQDLREVAEEGDQRADLHLAVVDPVGTEPQHGDAGHVERRGRRSGT